MDEPEGHNNSSQSTSSIQMWLARQGKYLKARPEIVMNYQNLLNWRPDKRKWPKKAEFHHQNSQNTADNESGYKVDIGILTAEIERKIQRLQSHKNTLVSALTELELRPQEAVKHSGILKRFLALPDWSFPTVEENMKANKLIAKVEDPAVLKDIAKALLIDLNNFIPTESELSVYQQMLFTKAEFIQACNNLIGDFPARYGHTRQFNLQQIMDIQENSIDERESVNGMLRAYLESIKHEHRLELADVKAKLSKKVTAINSLVEQLESPSTTTSTSEQLAVKLRQTKEFLDSVRSSFYALKLVYCDEQLERLEEFEKTTLPILREFANTATQNASPQEMEAKKQAQPEASSAFQKEMKPTEIVQFLKEAAAQRSLFLNEGSANVKREEALINSQSTKNLEMFNDVESLDHADEQPEDQQSLHKLISMSLGRKPSTKDFGEKRRELLANMKSMHSSEGGMGMDSSERQAIE